MPDGGAFSPRRLDRAQLDPFLQRLIAVAEGHGGYFVAFGAGEAPGSYEKLSRQTYVVENGPEALGELVAAFEEINRVSGLNGYISVGLFKPRSEWLNPTGRGKEDDLIGTLAFVGDFDGKHDPGTFAARLPLPPHTVVETSAGNRQAWFFLDRPYPAAEAKPVFHALARAAGADHTHSCEHLFRPPGTWNWPTAIKVKEGRSPVPQLARIIVGEVAW
jgi:hypothetical protein